MNKALYYAGIAMASAAFIFLVLREMTNHSLSVGAVGGLIAAVIVGGCILMGFSSGEKEQDAVRHVNAA
jgi:uncharacterized protein involved in response to NO